MNLLLPQLLEEEESVTVEEETDLPRGSTPRETGVLLANLYKETKNPSIIKAQERLDQDLIVAWMRAFPRKKKVPKLDKLREWEGYKPLFEKASESFREQKAKVKAKKEKIQEQILNLGIKPLPGDKEVEFAYTKSSMYSTQGWGADSYAKNRIDLDADDVRYHNIPFRIDQEKSPSGNTTYRLIISVEDETLDTLLLKMLPGPTLVDAVRMCWARGANPRVYWPFLPHGFEEKHGMDRWGRMKE